MSMRNKVQSTIEYHFNELFEALADYLPDGYDEICSQLNQYNIDEDFQNVYGEVE